MHYADNLSLELLANLIKTRNDFPVSIVFTYQDTGSDNGIEDLKKDFGKDSENVFFFDLKPINNEQIRDFCKIYFKNYKPNSPFEDWLYEKSKGVPGLMLGYISYFQKNSPFDEKGNLKEDLDNTGIFPENVNNAVANSIRELTDDEVNVLAICATEGVEFTAYLVAHLLNTDIVTTIKQLRKIQNKVEIFKSIGAKIKYGVKTTTYRFNQAYCHKYFENMLEYEEKISVHGQIAAFLKNKLEETSNKNLRHELAPFVAAHSIVSGDDETAKEMLLISAQGAKEIDGKEIIERAYEVYKNISNVQNEKNGNADSVIFQELLNQTVMNLPDMLSGSSEENMGGGSNYPIDFGYLRRRVVDEFHKGKYDKAIELIETYLDNHKKNLKPSEESQLLSLVARCYVEKGELAEAKEHSEQAMNVLENYKEPIPECFVLNVAAIIDLQEGNTESAFLTLKKAAKKSINLPPEIKLITIANIALLLKSTDEQKAEKYLYAVRKLTKQLNYEEFAFEVFN
jgi:tetratricopeptide (TPR) repeat protein